MGESRRDSVSSGDRYLAWILAFSFAVLAFAVSYELELRFDGLRVFKDYNVLFDTDPIVQLESLRTGKNRYGRNLAHPNLANLFNPPVRALVQMITRSDLSDRSTSELSRSLALLVVPAASGLKACVVPIVVDLVGRIGVEAQVSMGDHPGHVPLELVVESGVLLEDLRRGQESQVAADSDLGDPQGDQDGSQGQGEVFQQGTVRPLAQQVQPGVHFVGMTDDVGMRLHK